MGFLGGEAPPSDPGADGSRNLQQEFPLDTGKEEEIPKSPEQPHSLSLLVHSSASPCSPFVPRPGSGPPAAARGQQPRVPAGGTGPVPGGRRALPQPRPAPLLHGGKCRGQGGPGHLWAPLGATWALAGRAGCGLGRGIVTVSHTSCDIPPSSPKCHHPSSSCPCSAL